MRDDPGGDAACWMHILDDEGRIADRPLSDVAVRRVYEAPDAVDGYRVLVDRLWPRGLSRERARLDAWLRDLAPSDELRRWYGHDPDRWEEFERRYRAELELPDRASILAELRERADAGRVTLLCAARDPARSNAEVLRRVLAAAIG